MRFRIVLFAATLFAVGGSCSAPNEQGFIILRASPLTAGANGGITCTIDDMNFVNSGVLDLTLAGAYRTGYIACPVVQNRLISTAARNRGVESAQIYLQGIDVDVNFPPNLGVTFAPEEIHFREDIYDYLGPNDRAAVAVGLIPAATAAKLAAAGINDTTADVRFRFVGSSNGDTLNSNEMAFRVRICRDCLAHFVGQCCGDAVNKGSPNVAQDAAVDCCTQGGNVYCPARAVPGAMCM